MKLYFNGIAFHFIAAFFLILFFPIMPILNELIKQISMNII